MYINTKTLQYPISQQDIRTMEQYQATTFPDPFVAPEDYAFVFPVPQPTYDPITQSVVEDAPVKTKKKTWEQTWKIVDLDAEVVAQNQARKVEADLAAKKSARSDAVNRITVTVDGMTFDGDEVSQGRMARAIVAGGKASNTMQWVLSDNTVAEVTIGQLTKALAAAGAEQARIWIEPYV